MSGKEPLNLCAGRCNQEVRNPTVCEKCLGQYHPKCTNFLTVLYKGKKITVCKACTQEANPNTPPLTRSRTSSTSSNASTSSSKNTTLKSSTSSTDFAMLLNAINNVGATLQEHITTQDSHNADVTEQLATISTEMTSRFNELQTAHNALEQTVSDLKIENIALKTKLSNVETSIHRFESSEHNRDLLISGLPERENETESDAIIAVANAFDLALAPIDIIGAHRIKSTLAATNDRPRLLHVTLDSVSKRNYLLNKAKAVKNLNSQLIYPDEPGSRLFLNEWLPTKTLSLYRKAKIFARENNFKFAWHKNGKILLKRDETADSTVFTINTEDDLETVLA